jgi:hypothetical protein
MKLEKSIKIILIFLLIWFIFSSSQKKIENYDSKGDWEATGWFKNTGDNREKCNDGKNHNGYEYKYNAERNSGNNLCGASWCCKRTNGWESTNYFKTTGTPKEKCNDGKNHNGYEYKYNFYRHTGNNLCGASWCCKRKNGWEPTGWFKTSGKNRMENCNDGKKHDGYEYKYNAERNTGNNLCGNSWCCKRTLTVTSEIKKAVQDDKTTKITKYKNTPNKSCDDCETVMTILEPTIIVVYKLWVEREVVLDMLEALASAVILGTGQKMAENKLAESGAANDLKLFGEGQDDSGIIKKLKTAAEKSIFCLVKGTGKTALEMRKFTPHKLKKIIRKGLHSFIRCLITVFARLIVMEITGCNDYDSCDIKVDFAKAAEKYLKVIADFVDKQATKLFAESGITDHVRTQSDPNHAKKNTGSEAGDKGRGKTDIGSRMITFVGDFLDR